MALPALIPLAVTAGKWIGGALLARGIVSGLGAGVGAIRSNIPSLEDEVIVEVVGQPGASKQELYYLALATANGMVRRFQPLLIVNPLLPPTMGLVMIEYDAAENWVRATIRYKTGTATANIQNSTSQQRSNNELIDNLAVYRGPSCEVVGGEFDFLNTSALGMPGGSGIPRADRAPKLPFSGRTILTPCPKVASPAPIPPITQKPVPSEALVPGIANIIDSPNPKPPGDNRSRGAVVVPDPLAPPPSPGIPGSESECCPKKLDLVQLVFAALTDPGSFAEELWTGPTPGPVGK